MFDSQDKLIRSFGQSGTGYVQFQRPYGLPFDANNYLYVNDFSNDRVQKFDDKGAYLLQFGEPGSGNGQLNGPVGIVVHKDKVYVADNNNHRVSVFHLNGQFSLIIGSGQLRNPWDFVMTNYLLLIIPSIVSLGLHLMALI